MVKEDDLSILFTLNLLASANAILLRWVQVGVDVNHFSISSVSKEQSRVRVSINLEVWRVVVLNLLAFPGVVAQIAELGLDLLSL